MEQHNERMPVSAETVEQTIKEIRERRLSPHKETSYQTQERVEIKNSPVNYTRTVTVEN